jgi:hypothetical protein
MQEDNRNEMKDYRRRAAPEAPFSPQLRRQLLFLFWRQQAVTLRATHRSVVSPLAAVPVAVLAAASSSGSLAKFTPSP